MKADILHSEDIFRPILGSTTRKTPKEWQSAHATNARQHVRGM